MSIKTAVSAIALASAMLVAPAIAQDAAAAPTWTIGGNPVAEADKVAVQARCDELALETNTSLSDTTQDDQGVGEGTDDPTSTSDQPPAEGLDNATTTIDLGDITAAACVEGGWTTMAATPVTN